MENAKIVRVCVLVCGWALSGCKHACVFSVRQHEKCGDRVRSPETGS